MIAIQCQPEVRTWIQSQHCACQILTIGRHKHAVSAQSARAHGKRADTRRWRSCRAQKCNDLCLKSRHSQTKVVRKIQSCFLPTTSLYQICMCVLYNIAQESPGVPREACSTLQLCRDRHAFGFLNLNLSETFRASDAHRIRTRNKSGDNRRADERAR